MVSVTEVRMSPDLRHATVFVMPLLGAECGGGAEGAAHQHRLSAERGRAAGEHQICRQAQIPARRELRRGQPYRRAAARAQGGAGSEAAKTMKPSGRLLRAERLWPRVAPAPGPDRRLGGRRARRDRRRARPSGVDARAGERGADLRDAPQLAPPPVGGGRGRSDGAGPCGAHLFPVARSRGAGHDPAAAASPGPTASAAAIASGRRPSRCPRRCPPS